MKIQGAKKVHYDSGPNMTPMVDITMVILIFFMLCGNFMGAEHFLVSDVPLQANGAGVPPPAGVPIPTRFTIAVRQEGPFYVAKAGNFASVRSTDPKRAYDQLKGQLAAQLGSFKEAGVKTDDVQIIIYPQPNVTLDNLIPVEEAALDAGFKKVGFGVNTSK
jgi:biopolymer transport protein ExbD